MSHIVLKGPKRFLVGTHICGEGGARGMVIQVIPESVGTGGHSSIVNEYVPRVGYPEGGWDLVSVE